MGRNAIRELGLIVCVTAVSFWLGIVFWHCRPWYVVAATTLAIVVIVMNNKFAVGAFYGPLVWNLLFFAGMLGASWMLGVPEEMQVIGGSEMIGLVGFVIVWAAGVIMGGYLSIVLLIKIASDVSYAQKNREKPTS